jgi:hypothetical protein
VAVSVAFLVHGAVIANWVPRVPAVKAALGVSDGPLGLAMLAWGSVPPPRCWWPAGWWPGSAAGR